MKIELYGLYSTRMKSMLSIVKESYESIEFYAKELFEDNEEAYQIVKIIDLETVADFKRMKTEVTKQLTELENDHAEMRVNK